MIQRNLLPVMCAAVLAWATTAGAESPSDLLEKGIYTEETVGNLDEAIAIYQKVVAEAKANQSLGAQAQFRLGQCLLKQDKKAEATAAFERLVRDFPDEKELIAKARKYVPEGLPMGPVPWIDGEVMRIDMRLTTAGTDIGTVFYAAQTADLDGRKIWRVGSRTRAWGGYVVGKSSVDADGDTFRPIESLFKLSLMGEFALQYSPTQVKVTSDGVNGKQTKIFDQTKIVYDNEQCMHAMRRLPLTPDYKVTLPIFSPMGSENISLPLEVQGKETVKVPAGEFECFKVHLSLVNQDFFYSTDAHRYLVKFEAGPVSAELAAIDQIKPGESRQYEDADRGFSLTMPSEWLFRTHDGKLMFFDPRMVGQATMTTVKTADLKPEEQKSVRDWAKADIDGIGKNKKDFKLQDDAGTERTIAGLPGATAVTFVADYVDGKRNMIDYYTYIRNDSTGWKFAASMQQDDFEEFRKQFDAIIDSLKVKQP